MGLGSGAGAAVGSGKAVAVAAGSPVAGQAPERWAGVLEGCLGVDALVTGDGAAVAAVGAAALAVGLWASCDAGVGGLGAPPDWVS